MNPFVGKEATEECKATVTLLNGTRVQSRGYLTRITWMEPEEGHPGEFSFEFVAIGEPKVKRPT